MPRNVTLLGAGLVGSLLAILLRRRGHDVTIFERRADMRKEALGAGRSINLAMSYRGWKALELAGLKDAISPIALPMTGRFLHQPDGQTAFQAYGANGEAIYSVSRGDLNKQLMIEAEQLGVVIKFEHRCTGVDVLNNVVTFENAIGLGNASSRDATNDKNAETITVNADLLFGADGAFSALRNSYSYLDRSNASHHYIAHGYKELNIPAGPDKGWLMEKEALHIWPRHNFMLIALPNTDGSFTCTLFFPFEGDKASFDALKTEEEVMAFFQDQFPDAVPLMPTLLEDYFHNPTSSLITTRIFPWHYQDKSAVIGDAAHAIVPFYGQGMNAGFEDCTILANLMDEMGDDWSAILKKYEQLRQPAGDAVGDLALINFIEMRDKVADPKFLQRKKIEKELAHRYSQFTSIYEMVSFTDTPYDTVMKCIAAQDELLEPIQAAGSFDENLKSPVFMDKLDAWMKDYTDKVKQAKEAQGNVG